MANYDLTTILDECISRVQAGEPVSACVHDYPEYAEQLWPLLTAAADLSTLPRPLVAEQGRVRGRERMLAQLSQNPTQPVSFLAFLRYAAQKITGSLAKERPNMKLVLRSALTALCLLILSTAIVTASQNSLPGDPLYPVKRSWEWVQGSFVTVPEQASYQDELLLRRYQELQLLIETGRQVAFDLEGLLTDQTATTLHVAGFTIQTDADTEWLALPIIGEMVQIHLLVQGDGTLVAQQVAASDRPVPAMTATPTATVTRTPNSCTGGACPTATPTACTTPNCVTSTPTPCNTPNCVTPTPTPCTTSPNCVTPTVTRTPNCNPANCHTPTPTPWCGATICPTFTPTATPACNTGICPTPTPGPTITRTPNCTPSTCATATPIPTATPTACNTPNCTPPTATPTPGCNPANCPTVTSTPGCNAGACHTPTPTACPNTPNCTTVTSTPPPATATPTPACNPNNCPTNTPTPTRGCNTGTCATPPPTPTQCNTPNCVTPTFTPPPGCSPTNCPTPTSTPWCGATVCPTFTPTIQGQNKGLHSLHIRFH